MSKTRELAAAAVALETLTVMVRDVVPYAVVGLAGGALAVRFGGVRRPSAGLVVWALLRSMFFGVVAAQFALGFGLNGALAVGCSGLASLLAEQLLTGLSRAAGQWADSPVGLLSWLARRTFPMRLDRGLETERESETIERPDIRRPPSDTRTPKRLDEPLDPRGDDH